MGRVRRFDLSNALHLAWLSRAGGSLVELGQLLAPELGVPDLKVGHTAPQGDLTRLFVESESFADTGCCDMKNAKPWPEAAALLQGIAGADSGRTLEPGPGTAGPAPQGGTP